MQHNILLFNALPTYEQGSMADDNDEDYEQFSDGPDTDEYEDEDHVANTPEFP